jgi:hypothetical protein
MVNIGDSTNKNTVLDHFICDWLKDHKYQYIPKNKFKPAKYLNQPIYTRHFQIGKSIYGTPLQGNFVIYHPKKWPDYLLIESKWQKSTGTVDEKFPYFILNIQLNDSFKTIVLLDGGGYRKKAEDWMRRQVGKNLLNIFSMVEFKKWASKGNL